MAKVGRNEQCPCGSGKKYKKCHGGTPVVERGAQAARGQTAAVQVPLNPIGMPGQVHHIIFVGRFADPNDQRNVSGPSGQPGRYKVVFVFSRPGYPLVPENQTVFSNELRGDSHLAILPPAFVSPQNEGATQIRIYANLSLEQLVFEGYPNEKGFLGKIVLESIEAQGFADAELKAYRALAPSLSNWSLVRDVPMHIAQIDSTEIATGNARTSIVNPYLQAAWAVPGTGTMSEEFRRYASLYREALSSNSSAYQFLCFFKMIEAIMARRGRLNAEARREGRAPRRSIERLPSDLASREVWLRAIFYGRPDWDPMSLDEIFPPDVLGKKMSRIVDSELRPLRVKIAHAILDSGEPTLMADEGLDLEKITKWLPLTKCVVRRMLKDEFPAEFLPFLSEDGTVGQ
jgi:hypothetical protein